MLVGPDRSPSTGDGPRTSEVEQAKSNPHPCGGTIFTIPYCSPTSRMESMYAIASANSATEGYNTGASGGAVYSNARSRSDFCCACESEKRKSGLASGRSDAKRPSAGTKREMRGGSRTRFRQSLGAHCRGGRRDQLIKAQGRLRPKPPRSPSFARPHRGEVAGNRRQKLIGHGKNGLDLERAR